MKGLTGKVHSLFYKKGIEGGEIIRDRLLSGSPLMIARFGAVEIKGMLYSKFPQLLRRYSRQGIFSTMRINAGFFPANEENILRFSNLMFQEIGNVDILGSWRIEELLVRSKMRNATFVELRSLEPYYWDSPWSDCLEGKKVLVVHPFAKTIMDQYENRRKLLFNDPRVLPEFRSLHVIKAVQTIAGNDAGFATWFDALDYMKSEISKCDFDVAILGCGAYGFPLASYVKRMGKQAIHIGGATQILFGIRGKRWDNIESVNRHYNDHWVRPLPEDIPSEAKKVENGCYW